MLSPRCIVLWLAYLLCLLEGRVVHGEPKRFAPGLRSSSSPLHYHNVTSTVSPTNGATPISTNPTSTNPDCGPVNQLVNGNISFVSVNGSTTVGANVTFSCEEGYKLIGGNQSTCQEDGNWTIPHPECKKLCKPVHVVNGNASPNKDITAGTRVRISCIEGYTLVGMPVNVCLSDGSWRLAWSICRSDCGHLNQLDHGDIFYANGTTITSQDAIVTFSCESGYQLVGVSQSICQADGQWSGKFPECKRDCGPLQNLDHGIITYVNGSTATYVGTDATFTCNEGYQLIGQTRSTCLIKGQWSFTTPECRIEACENVTAPGNGSVQGDNTTIYNSLKTYNCNMGYERIGSETIVCNASGHWNNSVPTCQIRNCGNITAPTNGYMTGDNITTYEAVKRFNCDNGYVLLGNDAAFCNATGRWNVSAPICQIKNCKDITGPENGSMQGDNTTGYNSLKKFNCNTGYERIGSETIVCNASGYWNDSVPTCQIRNCGNISAPSNGYMTGDNITTYEAVKRFHCDYGYYFIGYDTAFCNATGHWNVSAPICQIKNCGNISAPTNGYMTGDNITTYEAVKRFNCDYGYDIIGYDTAFCNATGHWNVSAPICQIKYCGGYVTLHNGNATYPNGTTFGSTLTYTCDRGYTLEGSITSYCNASGMWDTTNTICNIKACTPLHPVHGSVTPNNDTSIGVRVTYTCDQGYKLFGFSGNRCMPDGNWAVPLPLCTVDCGRLDHLAHENMSYIYGDGITTLGAVVTFSCDEGYQLIGDNTSECQADGHWSFPVPDCKIIDCGPPHPLAHEIVSYVNSTNKTTFGEAVKFSCDEGYYLVGGNMATCQADGRWSIQVPICRIKDCERKITLANGDVSYPSGSTYGSKLTFTCDAGYTLEGPNTAYCDSTGTWNNISTVCKIKDCGRSLTINNGNITYPSITTFGSMLTLSCQDGFTIEGSNTSYCDSTGTWNNTGTICKIKACSPLHPAHGSVTPYNDTSIGVQVQYSCEQGYTLFGFSRNRCMPDGNWAVSLPLCQVDCGRLDHLTHENISYIYGDGITTLGAVVTFICDEGYQVVGDNTSECQADGHWSAPVPECKIIDCGYLNQLGNGSFSYVGGLNSTLFGAIVTFSCEEGYLLVGDNQSTCQADGRWSALLPKCEITCKPVDLAHGHVTPSSNVTAGRIVDYSCDDGYTLIGFVRNQCMSDGHWAVPFPECKRGCRRLYHPSHGKISYIYGEGITTFGAVVTFTCDEGYNLIGDAMSICKPDGHWSAEVPECRIKDCGHLHHLDHGNITYVNGTSVTDVGALVRFRCDEGYQLIGDSQSVCQADGHWSFSSPECKTKL